jgi:site-specific recombinase XerD
MGGKYHAGSVKKPGFWMLDAGKFLAEEEVRALRSWAFKKAVAVRWKRRSAVMEWIVTEIAAGAGLRVSEIANLQCGDVEIKNDRGTILVRRGKGGKTRLVLIGGDLGASVRRYLDWKESRSEATTPSAPLLLSKGTGRALTTRALQKMFKRVSAGAGIVGHSIHHLRHTYATHLHHVSGNNLRLVQQQLGHSSIAVTQVYAHVLPSEAEKAVNMLFKS